ncbi:hypothetical protein BDR07DRAFT_637985 [Suillus spraguei]|nr:hypothetical protein BDR07DRAFT_637985 [Suillus spraguei]
MHRTSPPCLHPIGRAIPATVCIAYFLTASFVFDWDLRELVIAGNLRDSHMVSYGASGKCQSVESHEIPGMVLLGAIGVRTNKLLCFLSYLVAIMMPPLPDKGANIFANSVSAGCDLTARSLVSLYEFP